MSKQISLRQASILPCDSKVSFSQAMLIIALGDYKFAVILSALIKSSSVLLFFWWKTVNEHKQEAKAKAKTPRKRTQCFDFRSPEDTTLDKVAFSTGKWCRLLNRRSKQSWLRAEPRCSNVHSQGSGGSWTLAISDALVGDFYQEQSIGGKLGEDHHLHAKRLLHHQWKPNAWCALSPGSSICLTLLVTGTSSQK